MRYRWMDCPKCQCHLAINTTETPEGISGSLRRWSVDRSINDGKLVRIPIPPLTEERRKQLAKQVHEVAEDHRTAVRNIRRDANERLKKMLKDKQISEDNERDGLEEVQKLTNTYIARIDELSKTKEHEIVSV